MTTTERPDAPGQQESADEAGGTVSPPLTDETPPPAAPPTVDAETARWWAPDFDVEPAEGTEPGRWRRTRQVLMWSAVAAVIVAVAWGIYRNNRLAGGTALIASHLALLAVACLDGWRLRPRPGRLWSIWIPRVCYPVGLLLGVVVAIDSSNLFPRLVAIFVLLGVHAVAIAAVATIAGHFIHGGSSLPRPWQLVVSVLIGLGAIVIAVVVDVEAVYQNVNLSKWSYVGLVIVTVLAAGIISLRRMRKDQDERLPSVSFLVGYSCVVGGAAVLVASLVLMAFWRNNDPVAGPPIHDLPVISGISGEYVALGDSYAAGEGLRPFEPFTGDDHAQLGNGCHRSQVAYSQLLRFEAPVPATRFVACSGAVINDVFKPYVIRDGDDQVVQVPAQVPAGVRTDVGLVTISIGGNDAVFSAVVRHCFLHDHCLDAHFTPPEDNLDRSIDLPDAQALDAWAAAVLRGDAPETIQSKIGAVYAGLRAAYPRARILVIGYPYLFPDGAAPLVNVTDCQTILRRFDKTEREGVRERQDDLNQLLHDEAIEAGLEFVSPTAGWDTHEPCGSSGEQYTNSIKPFLVTPLTGLELGDGGSFHPTDAGQRELARLVTCYLVANAERPEDDVIGAVPIGAIDNPVPECLPSASQPL